MQHSATKSSSGEFVMRAVGFFRWWAQQFVGKRFDYCGIGCGNEFGSARWCFADLTHAPRAEDDAEADEEKENDSKDEDDDRDDDDIDDDGLLDDGPIVEEEEWDEEDFDDDFDDDFEEESDEDDDSDLDEDEDDEKADGDFENE
jgi:hypothetical protein